ncbi:lysoplasmalogenase [Leptospira sp. 2 VSF19]|uniref:Lysoplasmalogenase n=1 Tax=Leptospira soteropolitanensis TaxID=2950025 RepID=A0AAW5VJY8_9LEPT|nr:lysoplasmalogenase [Leptospira soteropolitanensis]MCW7492424.1 lysoplasmalogenase [Leptospira soteropolitanensis]MCW7500475.1 lysoplasmalogenase [Leptospira soteropolitanensis]MCW7522855.1 lysoplasmalogenase [Leptospira soteropolitanensis]MCW7526714.1 lysoplasmalogenase [Leptospira soteropolitanensis]MCW7530445.1 lysoplasmalogenase [Leptospira soteropolitanensis]
MAKEIVLFVLYSIVHFFAIATITKEDVLYLPSKIIPILILIVALFRYFPSLEKRGKLIAIGLVFSLFGDSFLALPKQGYFVFGLGSFLIAQLIYSYAFTLDSKIKPILAIPFLLFGCSFFLILVPKLGSLLVPVGVYISAICLMGWRAAARNSSSKPFYLGLIGALVFILSDSIIAYSMFLKPEMDRFTASMGIMVTYYIAQLLIYSATKVEEIEIQTVKNT